MRIHTAAELREIDAHASRVLGVPPLLLMENAGRAVAQAAIDIARGGRVWVVCGKGNNGGDGWVAARHLAASGASVRAVSLCEPSELRGDALLNANAALACGVPRCASLDEAGAGDLVVDGILGTGIARPAEGRALDAIRAVNATRARGAKVLSIDLPSGVDGDVDVVRGEAVRADFTVTLHALKPALTQYPARALAGEIRVGSLGIPGLFAPGPVRRWSTRDLVAPLLPRRAPDAHKGTAGHVLIVAGSAGKSGAAILATRGALRAGAGLVTVASAPEVIDRILPAMPEAMAHPLRAMDGESLLEALQGRDVLVIGPGIARTEATGAVIVELLSHVEVPAVVDADGLNALAAARESLQHLAGARVTPVLTPHPAELARLLECSIADVQADRFGAATRAARDFRAHVVLKGAASVLAHPDGSLEVNSTGNPAMASGGTGDVLAGACGALLAQGLAPADAALVGMYVHGRAGDVAAEGRTRGLLAWDLAEALPDALAELS